MVGRFEDMIVSFRRTANNGRMMHIMLDVRGLGFDNIGDLVSCPGYKQILRCACKHRWPALFGPRRSA